MSLSDDLGIRTETVSMNDVADFIDYFSEQDSWTPTFSVNSPMTIGSTAIQYAVWYPIGDLNIFYLKFTATIGGTSRFNILASLPLTSIPASYHPLLCSVGQPNSGSYQMGHCYPDGTDLVISKYDRSEFAASTIDVNIFGIIRQ